MSESTFTKIWTVSFGLFFGSILGRMEGGYVLTFVAALGMLAGLFGGLLSKNKRAQAVERKAEAGQIAAEQPATRLESK